jgi:hypothetical protein
LQKKRSILEEGGTISASFSMIVLCQTRINWKDSVAFEFLSFPDVSPYRLILHALLRSAPANWNWYCLTTRSYTALLGRAPNVCCIPRYLKYNVSTRFRPGFIQD